MMMTWHRYPQQFLLEKKQHIFLDTQRKSIGKWVNGPPLLFLMNVTGFKMTKFVTRGTIRWEKEEEGGQINFSMGK